MSCSSHGARTTKPFATTGCASNRRTKPPRCVFPSSTALQDCLDAAMTSCCWPPRRKTPKPRSTPSRRWRRGRSRSSALRTAWRTSAWRRERFANVYGVFVWCPADYLTPGQRSGLVCAEERDSSRRLLSAGAERTGRGGRGRLSRRDVLRRGEARHHAMEVSQAAVESGKRRRRAVRDGRARQWDCAARACAKGSPASKPRASRSSRTTRRTPRVSSATCILERSQGESAAAGRRGRASSAGWGRSRPTTSTEKSCGWGSSTACRRL